MTHTRPDARTLGANRGVPSILERSASVSGASGVQCGRCRSKVLTDPKCSWHDAQCASAFPVHVR